MKWFKVLSVIQYPGRGRRCEIKLHLLASAQNCTIYRQRIKRRWQWCVFGRAHGTRGDLMTVLMAWERVWIERDAVRRLSA